MFRGYFFAGLLVAACLVCAGCGGGSDYAKQAESAKPVSIGTPDKYPIGATELESYYWVVKAEEEGETRLWVLSSQVPRVGGKVQWDEERKIFFDTGREHRYDIHGYALHTVKSGRNEGGPGLPLKIRPVEFDSSTGEILLYKFKTVPEKDRTNPSAGAYIVVG